MTGQIPKYGKFFRRVRVDYSPALAGRKYEYKPDTRYYTRSDKTSKVWHVYGIFGEFGEPQPSLTKAMEYIMRHLSSIRETEPKMPIVLTIMGIAYGACLLAMLYTAARRHRRKNRHRKIRR